MEEYPYQIIDSKLENENHSKVYILQNINSRTKLLVKIFEKPKHIYYQNEIDILRALNEIDLNEKNNYYVNFTDIDYNENRFEIPMEIRNDNLKFLFFENLPNLSLCDYLWRCKENIKEIHAKVLCYKLLSAIENLRKINILHNKLNDTSNIMFDQSFNAKIIHFCEAKKVEKNNKYKLNKDFFDLGILLANIISFKRIYSVVYNAKDNKYDIIYKDQYNKMNQIDESQFWEMVDKKDNIKQFKDFFHILIKSKKENQLVNITTLYDNEWLKEIKQNHQIHENNFKDVLKLLYETINNDISSFNSESGNASDMFNAGENETMSAINIINKICIKEKKGIPLQSNFEKMQIKPKKTKLLPKIPNKNNIKENNEIKSEKQIENIIPFTNQSQQNNNNVVIKLRNKQGKNSGHNTSEGEKNIFKPRKGEFNYLKLNIKNTENVDMNQAINNYMKVFKNNIKDYFEMSETSVNFEDIKDKSFKICYEIPPMHFDDEDDIEFLDEDFEQKVKNIQRFKINVELLEGEKNLETSINEYFLVFKGISVGKEDFYDHLKILLDIAKTSLKKDEK